MIAVNTRSARVTDANRIVISSITLTLTNQPHYLPTTVHGPVPDPIDYYHVPSKDALESTRKNRVAVRDKVIRNLIIAAILIGTAVSLVLYTVPIHVLDQGHVYGPVPSTQPTNWKMTKAEALESAWESVGGKCEFNFGEVALMEALANSADSLDGNFDEAILNALESGEVREESSVAVVAFIMEFCRLYLGE